MVALILTPRMDYPGDAFRVASEIRHKKLNPDRVIHSPDGLAPETGRVLAAEFSKTHPDHPVPVGKADQLNPSGRAGDVVQYLAGQNEPGAIVMAVTHRVRIPDVANQYLHPDDLLPFARGMEAIRPGQSVEIDFPVGTWGDVEEHSGRLKFIPELDHS